MNPADLRLSAYREVSLEYDHDPNTGLAREGDLDIVFDLVAA